MFSNQNFLLHHELYDLEFRFLPEIFEIYEKTKKNPGINFDEEKLVDIEFFKTQFKSRYINWDEFKFEKKELSDKVKEFIYCFGTPKDSPLCYYAIFYVDEANKIYKYFTLEKTASFMGEDAPYVCGQKGAQHINYGIRCPSNIESFENIIKTIANKNTKPINGFNSDTLSMGPPKNDDDDNSRNYF